MCRIACCLTRPSTSWMRPGLPCGCVRASSPLVGSRQDVERIVARMAGIPARTVSGKERDRLKTLKDDLGAVLFGQDEAVDIVTRAILPFAGRARQDGSSRRFVPLLWTHRGRQDGTRQAACRAHGRRLPAFRHERVHGKTRRVAAYRRASRLQWALIRGGLLTEAVRKTPYAVVLMDEIEKAHPTSSTCCCR